MIFFDGCIFISKVFVCTGDYEQSRFAALTLSSSRKELEYTLANICKNKNYKA